MAKNKPKNDKKPKGPHATLSDTAPAAASISRAKAWAALAGFALVGFYSYRAGVEPFEVGIRALAAGVVAYLVAWAIGIALWRRIVVHKVQAEAERLRQQHEAARRKMLGLDEEDEEDAGDREAAA